MKTHNQHTCIARCANFGFGQALLVAFTVTKVSDLHKWLWAAIKKGVLKLYVAVDHSHLVTIVQPNNKLLEKPPCIIFLQKEKEKFSIEHVLEWSVIGGGAPVGQGGWSMEGPGTPMFSLGHSRKRDKAPVSRVPVEQALNAFLRNRPEGLQLLEAGKHRGKQKVKL